MPDIHTPEELRLLPTAVMKNIITLSTSGFGLVVALAWNQVVQAAVQRYIDPYLGLNSGMVSLLIYAVVITVLAVFVIMQLTRLQRQLELLEERVANRRKKQKIKHSATHATK
jgi:hypothetical protein